MAEDRDIDRIDEDQLTLLTDLVGRARARGIHTGVRTDELHDLNQEDARDLIEQLQRRLGEVSG